MDAGLIMNDADTADWTLRASTPADVEVIAELRAVVMRPDLERLGVYDEVRVRQRLRNHFSFDFTRIVMVDGELAGSVTLRPAEDREWLEHFYLEPRHQGRGLGTAVLAAVLEAADARHATVALQVMQGSPARRLYERHGFTVETEDSFDVFMVRPAAGGATSA
ncbi:GNAT family N-acetyltransferase [Streptomyces sp. HUAS MG47]|uniref:GNAT family N-acetyltransferase n=1 Tax=Streptomyces solicamelliae TaxID=3231716 RepID=UPI003877F9A2